MKPQSPSSVPAYPVCLISSSTVPYGARDGLTVEFQNAQGTRSVGDADHKRMILSARLAPRVLFRSSPPSPGRTGTTVEITRARAGWRYVHFAVRQIAPGKPWTHDTGAEECCLVLLAGHCQVAYTTA